MCIITSLVAALGIILASIFFILSTLTGNDYDGDTEYKYKVSHPTGNHFTNTI